MMKRSISRRGALQLSAGLVAAVATGRVAAQDASAPASLKRAGKTLLNFRAWEKYPSSDIPQLNRYLDRNPDLSVQWVSMPFGRYRDAMIAEFVAQTPLDVVQVPETELAGWADSGWLMPLDGLPGLDDVLKAATPTAVQGTKGLNGKTYALPFLSDAFGFAYDHARSPAPEPSITKSSIPSHIITILPCAKDGATGAPKDARSGKSSNNPRNTLAVIPWLMTSMS